MASKSSEELEQESGYFLSHPEPGEEIVISGISGKFPECSNIDEFIKNIFDKKNLSSLNETRWEFTHPEFIQHTAKVPDPDKFDAAFFGMDVNSANVMDISYRMSMEKMYEAIWDAGLNLEEIKRTKTGIFSASCLSEGWRPYWVIDPQKPAIYVANRGVVTSKLSFHLEIDGPSVCVDTACSASIYAVNYAFLAMRKGEVDNAIVIGANTAFMPYIQLQFSKLGVLNQDGRVKTFSEDADGYTRAESSVAIILQKAKHARRIYGQIVHVKANCDGYKTEGITYPSGELQARLQKEVLQESGVHPNDVKYVECHGTGTKVGDPIELNGVESVFCQNRKEPLLIGSIKSNIGHSEPGAGLCAVAKVIIAMETGYIPPQINISTLRKAIPGLHNGNMKVVMEKTKFQGDYAGVNSFGFGGANANVLLKRNLKEKINKGLPSDNLPRLVVYSGRTPEALKALSNDLGSHSLDAEYVGLLHEIFKFNTDAHFHRGFTIVDKKRQLMSRGSYFSGVPKTLWFIFSGPGSQWHGMGTKLMEIPIFKESINRCHKCLSIKNIDLETILTTKDEKIFENHINVMVAITSMQVALVDLLNAIKIVPNYIFGYSIGELACAYADNALTLEQAVLCAYYIGQSTKNKGKDGILLNNLKKVIPNPKKRSSKWRTTEENKIAETFSAEYLVHSLSQSFSFNKIFPRRAIILEISPHCLLQRLFKQLSDGSTFNLALIDKENGDVVISFLETIGELYMHGQNPRIQEIYPKIQFPVSRGTRMISPLIKWDHKKSLLTYETKSFHRDGNSKDFNYTFMYRIYPADDIKILSDHKIDGRFLYPATGYLYLAWRTYLSVLKQTGNVQESIVFEDIRFLRATNLSSCAKCYLGVTFYPVTGSFEIVEGSQVVVTGFARKPTQQELAEVDEIPALSNEDPSDYVPLRKKDIYKEFRLRGYNYGPHFNGILEYNHLSSSGKLKWDDNYITFMDTMLQVGLIKLDSRGLFIPTTVEKVVINKEKHNQCIANLDEDSAMPVYSLQKSDKVVSGGISIKGVKVNAISRRKPLGEPVLESYKFIPNLYNYLTLEESIRVVVQLALENVPVRQVKTMEILETKEENIISPLVLKVLEDLPLIQADTNIITDLEMDPIPGVNIFKKKLTEESGCLLVILKNIMDKPKLVLEALNTLLPDGFLILRESLTFNFQKFLEHSKSLPVMDVIVEHRFQKEQIILVRNRNESSSKLRTVVKIRSDTSNFDWLPVLQRAVKNDPNTVVYSEGSDTSGVLGLINCIRKEPGTDKVRAVIIYDDFDIKFDLKHEFYASQLRKGLGINILKEGVWGTYRHLKLPTLENVPVEHAFVNPMVRGDLSSLRWLEKHEAGDRAGFIPVKVYYSSLNFRDIMTATGRVPPEVVAKDRFEIECVQGLEYSGRTLDGQRVMGLIDCQGLATDVEAKLASMWYVPDNWTLEQAATVPVVYSTVYYGLIMEGRIRKGQSILIHSGTGGIGQSAINVALHYGLTVFTTVGTPEKREFIKTHWPQIQDSHIGNSRDTSFEQMIMEQTNGRGVDLVLNSLAEDKLQASIRCVAHFGKFLEIGKFDLAQNNTIRLELFKRHAAYHGVMLDQVPRGPPNIQMKIKVGLNQLLKEGAIKPLNSTVFDTDQVEEAFRYMGTGKHTGKILVKIRDEEPQRIVKPPATMIPSIPRYIPSPEKSYIITGGLGGFGLELADWLIIRGAKNLVLSSRKGITTGYQSLRIKFWKTYGVNIKISKANIHTLEGCKTLIKEAIKLGPVEGIFNLAVVLQDAILDNQTKENFETSFGPKPIATKHLDELSRRYCRELRLFVVFSSVSCGRGNAGQTNYGMGNSIMERICEKRKRDGFPALAVQWGAVGEVGLVAEMQDKDEELEIGGTLQQRISSCLSVLDTFLRQEEPVVSSMVVAEKRQTIAGGNCVEAVLSILGVKDVTTVNLNSTLAELGMDSITAVEIKQTMERDYEIFLSQQDIRSLTLEKLQKLATKEEDKSQTDGNLTEVGFNLLSRLFGKDELARDSFVVMPSLKEGPRNKIMLVPGIEGNSAIMAPLAENLKGNVTCFQYAVVEKPIKVEELAAKIFEILKNEDEFTIVGHSIGTLITLEVAFLLESFGKKGRIVLIDGSPMTMRILLDNSVNKGDEKDLEDYIIDQYAGNYLTSSAAIALKAMLESCKTWDEKVAKIVAEADENINAEFVQKTLHSIYNKSKAVCQYEPKNLLKKKLKSKVKLIKPTLPVFICPIEDYGLSELLEEPVEVVVLEGTHISVTDNKQCAEEINAFLEQN